MTKIKCQQMQTDRSGHFASHLGYLSSDKAHTHLGESLIKVIYI